MPLVAVVTPVYNGAPYLAECIESVLSQTYPNWTLLVADNCSTDGSAEIAGKYETLDGRIHVCSFDRHLTVIRNWNRTLELLPREAAYCKFVLADDWLYPECLERMVALAENHPSVGIVGAYGLYGDEVALDALPATVEVMSGRDAARHHLLGGRYFFGSPTSLLFRAEPIRERQPEFFDELQLDGRPSEWVYFQADTDACYAVLEKSDFGFVHQVLSYSRQHDETITRRWTVSVGTWLPGHLLTLLRFGPSFLDESELNARVHSILRRYRRFLVRSALTGRTFRDDRFRDYHREAIERIRPRLGRQHRADGTFLALFAGLVRER